MIILGFRVVLGARAGARRRRLPRRRILPDPGGSGRRRARRVLVVVAVVRRRVRRGGAPRRVLGRDQTRVIAEAVDLARRRATREHARPDGARAGRLGAESWLRPGACAGRGSGAGATAVPRAGPRSGSRSRPNANGLNEERHRVRMHAARPLAAPVVAVERLPSLPAPPVAVSQKYQRGNADNGRAARYGRALALFTGEVRWRSGPLRVLWRRSRFDLARCVFHVPRRSALHPAETSPLFLPREV